MPSIDWSLVGTLLVLMLLAQAVCWLIARGLRLRLERFLPPQFLVGCAASVLSLSVVLFCLPRRHVRHMGWFYSGIGRERASR